MKGIRTIALRLTGTKEAAEELEEMGEDTSDMIMSQSKMRDLIMNATRVASNNYQGFDIQDELGRYKSTYEIMLGLAQIWDEIQQADFKTGDNRQNLLLESIAGKNRASIAASILQNPETLQSVYEDSSTKAAGSAMEENQKYLESISGHLAKLQNAWQEMWANAANRDVINMFIDFATLLLNIIDKVGLLGSTFALVWGGSILKGLMTADSWLVKFIQGLNNAKESSQGLGEVFKTIFSTGDSEKGSRLKGLAQIYKDKENRTKPTTPETSSVPEVAQRASEVTTDMTEVATKNIKAEASKNATQANMQEMASEEALKKAQQENTIAETEETIAKTEGASASQRAVQENIKEAESIKLTTEAIKEKAATEALQYQDENPQKYKGRKKRRMPQHDQKMVEAELIEYYQNIADTADEAAEASMDWTLAYVGGFDKIESSAEETTGVFSKISTGFGSMLGSMSSGLSSLGSSLSSVFVTLATNPMTWLVGIPALIGVVNVGLSMWQKHQQALIDGAHEATTAWNDNKTSLDNYIQQYQDLHTQLDNINLSEEEQANIKKQLFDLQKQITDEYGHQADGVNLVNGQLDEQIQKLRTINKEQATNNLGHNATEYNKAIDEMERQRTLEISSSASLSDEDFKSLVEGIEGIWGRYTDQSGAEIGLTFTGNATEAEKAMDELFARLSEKQDEMKQDWEGSTYELLTNGLEEAIRKNDETLSKFKDDYNSYLEQSIYAQDGTFGKDNLSAGDALIEAQKAVNDYNIALLSGDSSQIEKTKDALDEVKQAADEVVDAMGDQRFNRPFQDIFDQVNKTQEEAYNVKKKFDDPKVKNIVESVLGTPQENKKSAKEIPDALRDAAENILNEQRKAYEWGMKPFGVNPLQMMYSQSQFGNIDMNNRPTIKWDDNWRKQFADALKSWNYNPENGTIDTVFGGSDNFNGLEIAYTPILATKDGKVKDFMSYDAVHDYIQGLVEEATDEEGNIDAQMVLNLDADKKQIIGAIDGIGKYSAQTVGKMMHFSGKKGAISLGMEQLSKAAKDAGIDVQKVLDILQKTGNVDALSGLFDDFKYDVTDIEGYLSNLSNLPPEIADDILTIADAFGITANSSQDSINAVAELLGSLGYIATTSLDEAGESFDKFAQKASGWIEETTNLSSVLSKGQGFLTFTKTQDDQGHEIASEVKALADAYKDLPGYNYASLFEETAGGIMVNAEALRALQSQEESMRHAEFYEKRQELMEHFTASSGAAAEAYRAQIEELDMLWAAYSGATSALSKYQNNHGAADYSTNYKLFRDQIFKEGDEYLTNGEIGEEGFRRIAQLLSYKDLALASVEEVKDAYINGADTMQKFFTEVPAEGAALWADEVMSWSEEYAKITTDETGKTIISMTDQNLDAVAERYSVSKDLILSLMNELNATGSRIHFFTDGQMQQLEEVNERAEAARKALIGMKEQGTDPALANSDILNFDMANMSAEELEAKIKEIQDFKKVNPDIDTETASLLDELLKSAIESLDIINGKEVKPQIEMDVDGLNYTKEVTEDLNERLKQISEYKELGYDISISGDDKVREVSQEIAAWSEEMQKAYGFEPSVNPEDIAKQIEEKFPNGVELKVAPKLEQEEVDAISSAAPEVKVNADTLPAQTAIQELGDDFTPIEKPVDADTTEAEEKTDSLLDKITATIKAIFGMEVYADEVDEAREEAEQPIETDVHFNPDNSIQDAANQAGAQQGVNTTTTETKVTNEETHTVATTDTAQLDVLNQKMQSVQAMGGSTISIGVAVSGIENIEAAENNINTLIAKDKSKVTVYVYGNAVMFNKTYTQTNSALTALAKKVTEPKITANNSNLKDKVEDSKSKLRGIDDKKVKITASTINFGTISSWKTDVYDKLHDKEIKIKTTYTSSGTPPKGGGGGFQGSAHNQGTIVSKGHAYAGGTLSGNWGLPQAEKGALINELGSEIVVTPDGHWQILNGGDPTFTNLPKGAIIFNHKQTESLLKKGYINGSHGKMVGGAFVTGTVDDEDLDGNAYAVGTAKWNGQLSGNAHYTRGVINKPQTYTRNNTTTNKGKTGSGGGGGGGGGGNHHDSGHDNNTAKKAKDNLQTLDAIEIRLNRIDALIARLDTNAAKTYDTFANRNTALKDDLATVNKEIRAINTSLKSTDKTRNYLVKAADAAKEAGLKSGDEGYSSKSEGASGKALSQNWINKIKNFVDNGKYFTVTDVRNEGLWKKIQAYQTWYEKYVKLQQKVQDQTNKLSQLTIQQLTLIQTKWETSLNNIAADITKWQNTIDLANEKGYDAAEKYYNAEILLNKNRTKKLEAEAKELENKLKEAVKTGRIKEGSEEWYKWHIQIKNVKNEIIATNKEIQSLLNSIRQIRWDTFDRGQDELADMIDEAEFLGGLINEIDLFDKDTGFVTDKGKAAFGLEAQKYDLYIKQAQKYGEAVKELNAEIAKDPNNKTLIDQRNTWLKAQREAIENAHAEKEAIADLIEKGIKKQIEAMEELIDKYEKALDAEKDQQKYADNVAEKQKKINSLQKQLRSIEGDDSEEGATRRQKLRDELKEAQKDLKEAQEDQRISDIKDALSDMQERYEEFLNTKLENIDALLQEVVSGVNQSGADICSTIQDVAHSVNYTISSNLQATYTAVQNLGANVASIANQIGALVSGTSDTTGTMTNTSATTVRNAPTPVVPTKVTMPTEPKKTTGSTGTSKAKNGIVKENGKTYYYKNGKKQTGWQTINGKKYYFSTKDSNMLTGVQKIGNKYYLLDKSTGVLKDKYSGLYKQNSGTYYFKNGDMQTGWQSMNAGKRYFSTKNGKMLTGVQTIGKDNYYFNEDGVLQVGKFNVGDYTYETDKDGKIKKKTRRTGGVTSIKGNTILSTMSYIEGKGTGGITGFASGTKKVPKDDIYRVDEMGKEAFINKQGKIYTRLEKGTTVLPHDAAVNLLKGMSNPAEFIASHMDMRPNKTITTTNNNTGNTVNNITFNLPNVSDYKEFMREAQRDPNFTKYIQEISIGKLNGNNSLKGNAIQFR